MDAAAWLRAMQRFARIERDLKALLDAGAPEEVVEQRRQHKARQVGLDPDKPFSLYAKLWPAFSLFLACETQWRPGPMGGRLGLDYGGVREVANAKAIELTPERFEELQILERAYLAELAQEREKAQAGNG